jgi:lipoic acid synthetase
VVQGAGAGGEKYRELRELIKEENLNTVCAEAACPNIGRVLVARHRDVHDPRRHLHPPLRLLQRQHGQADVERPARARARRPLHREDGPAPRGHHLRGPRRPADYGARIWAATIRQVRAQAPRCKVEVLTPDFRGQEMPLATVLAERPHVFNHNVEVVPRLYPLARRGSTFERSSRCSRTPSTSRATRWRRSPGLMVGLGESFEEVVDTLGRLRERQVQIITIGQYLRPTERHLPVVRYWHPDEFKALEEAGYALGFDHIAAGPLVRSSYHADQHVPQDQPGDGPLAAVAAG